MPRNLASHRHLRTELRVRNLRILATSRRVALIARMPNEPVSKRMIGECLRAAREAHPAYKDSQGSLGDALGVRQETISSWERGATTPKATELAALADKLGVSVLQLLGFPVATVELDPDTKRAAAIAEHAAEILRLAAESAGPRPPARKPRRDRPRKPRQSSH